MRSKRPVHNEPQHAIAWPPVVQAFLIRPTAGAVVVRQKKRACLSRWRLFFYPGRCWIPDEIMEASILIWSVCAVDWYRVCLTYPNRDDLLHRLADSPFATSRLMQTVLGPAPPDARLGPAPPDAGLGPASNAHVA
jgi:hypothetical protein